MSWNRLSEVVVVCLFGVTAAVLAVGLYYLPSMLSAEIAYKRAATKALSGLDLRDENVRRALRGLLGVEEVQDEE